ncbi:30S ribosome-binding factor RbfA [Anaplasma phagocytophilum]|uniref:30S ribosome-binding factor RbfA n=1 Tax=Anaplasma phagocytophilum TaxID=948 RepID=UPI00201A422D
MIVFDHSVGHRSLKVSSVLKKALSGLFLREFYDLSTLVSVSEVKVGEDLRNATIFVVVHGKGVDGDEIVRALNASSSVVRKSVFKYLKLRYVPRLHFKLDVEFENFLRISDALAVLND